MTNAQDETLAKKYGGYISYQTDTEPVKVEMYGESENEDFERLFGAHLQPASRVLDIGCGAGQFTCDIAGQAAELWAIDQEQDVIEAAAARADTLGLHNVHFLHGKTVDPLVLAAIPDDLDLIYTRRGPNMNKPLADKLKVGGIFLQLMVSEFDGYPLREIFGRREYSPYHFRNEHDLMVHYSDMNMLPISVKSYFFDVFFKDLDHLEAFLINIPANLTDWRMDMLPYKRERDRPALELFVRYQSTADGIRLQRHRRVMAFRKIALHYPIQR